MFLSVVASSIFSSVSYSFSEQILCLLCCCCSVIQSCLTLCIPMDSSMPGFPVHHQLPELAQTHVHRVSDALQPSHPLSSPSPPAFSLSQHQDLFQWVSSLHQMAKVLELQLQHQSFQWKFKTDFLYNWLVWSPYGPRDSQESSPTPQFKSISSSLLRILYGPAHMTTWKTIALIILCVHAKSLQLCPTLSDHMDCSLPGSSVHGILQTTIMVWVAMLFSRG